MNIFPIDLNPRKCAKWSCDQHVVKIISEAVLIYSSALYYYDQKKWESIPKEEKYGPINLPLVRWAINKNNRRWLAYYIYHLNKEYEYRYGRKHKAYLVFKSLSEKYFEVPYLDIILDKPEQDFVQCMPEEFKGTDSVTAYRKYYQFKYREGFKRPMRWTKREIPTFLKEVV